jgi:hypothetical protein
MNTTQFLKKKAMVKFEDLGELPLKLIFEMASETEPVALLTCSKCVRTLRPDPRRQDRGANPVELHVYSFSSLLFQCILKAAHELLDSQGLRTSQHHFTFLSLPGQTPFVALLFRSVLTNWVCLLFLGPLYNPVLLFGPTTWLTFREQQYLRAFSEMQQEPLKLKVLAFGSRSERAERPALLYSERTTLPESGVSFFTPSLSLDVVQICFSQQYRSIWPLSRDITLSTHAFINPL